jgi:HAMP domain-containing protein
VGNIAADEVGALAGHVNNAARQPDEAAVREAMPHLEAAVARMVDQLEDWPLGVTHAAGGR